MSAVSCILISFKDPRRPHKMASNRTAPPKHFLRGLHSQTLKVKNQNHKYSRTRLSTRRGHVGGFFQDQGFGIIKNTCSPELINAR